MSLPVGTILVWTRASYEELDPPVFAVVTPTGRSRVIYGCGAKLYPGVDLPGHTYANKPDDVAHNHVADPSEWPDELCALMARWALTGEAPHGDSQ
jgi:hypothetical protein